MKLTQMIEKFAKQGMLNGVARAELLQAAEETEQEMAELQEELSGKDGELAENRKTAAVERAILEGGGKNVKAILALLDLEEISYDAKEGLKGRFLLCSEQTFHARLLVCQHAFLSVLSDRLCPVR